MTAASTSPSSRWANSNPRPLGGFSPFWVLTGCLWDCSRLIVMGKRWEQRPGGLDSAVGGDVDLLPAGVHGGAVRVGADDPVPVRVVHVRRVTAVVSSSSACAGAESVKAPASVSATSRSVLERPRLALDGLVGGTAAAGRADASATYFGTIGSRHDTSSAARRRHGRRDALGGMRRIAGCRRAVDEARYTHCNRDIRTGIRRATRARFRG